VTKDVEVAQDPETEFSNLIKHTPMITETLEGSSRVPQFEELLVSLSIKPNRLQIELLQLKMLLGSLILFTPLV